MKALIIANGALPAPAVVRRLVKSADLVVCADGGANHARRLRVRPDVIIGDMDSISPKVLKAFGSVPKLFVGDQNSTDMEKALRFCIERRVKDVDVIGALGNRVDHLTGNLGCFKKFGKRIDIRFVDEVGELRLIRHVARLRMNLGDKLSLIPLERCTGVTTHNLKYSLHNASLELGVREGISNEASGENVLIRVKKGTLLLYVFPEGRNVR